MLACVRPVQLASSERLLRLAAKGQVTRALARTYFVTTPIFYVNADPHIGHLYSACLADASHRFHCLQGSSEPTIFSTGTDEHGTKVQRAATLAGVTPEVYAEGMSGRFEELFKGAGVEWTQFVRTTEDRHKLAVEHFWKALVEKELIYKKKYSGWYCVAEETFVPEIQLADSAGGKVVAQSGQPVEWSSEDNYVFRLSSFQGDIQKWAKLETSVQPSLFRDHLLHWLSQEDLQDISVSRPSSRAPWGIPVPSDPTHTIYVWLDALINYLTVAGYPEREKFRWPPSRQIIGKDILKFHGIYWPAFLMAAGLELPCQLWCHSHWTLGGEKMSKSKGNVVDPFQAAQRLSLDGLRYFLLREGVPHSDGSYSEVRAVRILNSELADTLGNLLSRSLAPAINHEQVIPTCHAEIVKHLCDGPAQELIKGLASLPNEVYQEFNLLHFHRGLNSIMAVLRSANAFFQETQPWKLAKSKEPHDLDTLCGILVVTMETLRVCGILLQPIIPRLATGILDQLGIPTGRRKWDSLQPFVWDATTTSESRGQIPIGKRRPLFQRIQQ